MSWCKQCRVTDTGRWRKQQGPNYRREESLLRKYKINHEDYLLLSQQQEHKCAVCGGGPGEKKKYFDVDHDHKTGKIRGLLCHSCNTGIGIFNESVEKLRSAKEYLLLPPRKAPTRLKRFEYPIAPYLSGWKAWLKYRYGISAFEYADAWDAQNGRCAICQDDTSDRYKLAVDHCHATKRIRGLLCKKCNTGLGFCRDNPTIIDACIGYLNHHR